MKALWWILSIAIFVAMSLVLNSADVHVTNWQWWAVMACVVVIRAMDAFYHSWQRYKGGE